MKDTDRVLTLHFNQAPIELISSGTNLSGVKLAQYHPLEISNYDLIARTTNTGPANKQRATFDEQSKSTVIQSNLVFRSIGYRSYPFSGVPFDDEKGVVPHHKGRVIPSFTSEPDDTTKGLYVVGWLKRGFLFNLFILFADI